MSHAIDINDLNYIEERYGKAKGWAPGAQKNGKVNPQVTMAWLGDDKFVSVFHVKPIYYETSAGEWRPLSEVTAHHGNHLIEFTQDWWKIHPRYMAWLDKRMKLIGGQLLIPSILSAIPTPYQGVLRSIHESLVPFKVGMTTSTFYPDPDTETTSVDGQAYFDASSTAWATQRTASDGAGANDNNTTLSCYVGNWMPASTNFYWLYRIFCLFDTSAIPDSDSIDSATFSLKPTSITNDDLSITTGNKGFRIVATTPASNTAITTADYDQVGSTAGCTDIAITSFSVGTYYDMALNATGLTWVSKTGVTKLGMRHLCDVNDEEPDAPGTADDYNYFAGNSSEVSGTTSDPKLVVVHTAGSSSQNSNFFAFF